jgi:hypothetical protein
MKRGACAVVSLLQRRSIQMRHVFLVVAALLLGAGCGSKCKCAQPPEGGTDTAADTAQPSDAAAEHDSAADGPPGATYACSGSPADGGSDSADAGPGQAGHSETCVAGQTYCLIQRLPGAGGGSAGRCDPVSSSMPACATNPTCACTGSAGNVNCSCRDDGGLVIVTCDPV